MPVTMKGSPKAAIVPGSGQDWNNTPLDRFNKVSQCATYLRGNLCPHQPALRSHAHHPIARVSPAV